VRSAPDPSENERERRFHVYKEAPGFRLGPVNPVKVSREGAKLTAGNGTIGRPLVAGDVHLDARERVRFGRLHVGGGRGGHARRPQRRPDGPRY